MKTGSSDSKASIFNCNAPLPKSSIVGHFWKVIYSISTQGLYSYKKWCYRSMISYMNRDTRYNLWKSNKLQHRTCTTITFSFKKKCKCLYTQKKWLFMNEELGYYLLKRYVYFIKTWICIGNPVILFPFNYFIFCCSMKIHSHLETWSTKYFIKWENVINMHFMVKPVLVIKNKQCCKYY